MFAMLKHKVRKMIQTDEVTTTSLSRKEKSTIRDEIELRYGKIKSTKSRKEKSLIRDEIEALYKKLNSGAETKKEDNKTLKKSKEILNKGLELTFDDLKFFTSDIVSELDKLVDEQNSEAIEVEALFDGVITMFSLGGKIQTDSIDNKSDVVASVSLITDEKGNYLIGKRRDSGKYSFIGGGIEDGETPLEAMIREAQEESGYIYSEDEITSLGNLSNEAVTIALFEMESKGNPSNASDNDEEFESFLFVDKETLLDGETIDFHIPIEKNLVIAYLKKGIEFDGVKEENLGNKLENLFTDTTISEANKAKALKEIQRLIYTNSSIKDMFEDIISKLKDDTDLSKNSLFDDIVEV